MYYPTVRAGLSSDGKFIAVWNWSTSVQLSGQPMPLHVVWEESRFSLESSYWSLQLPTQQGSLSEDLRLLTRHFIVIS